MLNKCSAHARGHHYFSEAPDFGKEQPYFISFLGSEARVICSLLQYIDGLGFIIVIFQLDLSLNCNKTKI